MTRRCSNSKCYYDDGSSCPEGKLDVADCPFWNAGVSEDESTPSPIEVAARVPWTGSALGTTDLGLLVPRARTIVVGVMGAHDTGKTTLLTAAYLQTLNGQQLASARFAGSRSLGAWESLAAWMRFEDGARPASFPPHTPHGTSRVPGLLHLALRKPNEDFRDILFTDAPGEWFSHWAMNENAPEAAGARWIAQHATAFLLFADCDRLSGKDKGPARNAIRNLIERLGNHVHGRPTMLIWAKADKQPSEKIRQTIREALEHHIPHATQANTTIEDPSTITMALGSVIDASWLPPRGQRIRPPVLQHEPFNAFRGHRADT